MYIVFLYIIYYDIVICACNAARVSEGWYDPGAINLKRNIIYYYNIIVIIIIFVRHSNRPKSYIMYIM